MSRIMSPEKYNILKSYSAALKTGSGGRRYVPYALTQQGVVMLSSVLKSKRAIEENIAIMRAFVKVRKMLASNDELKRKLAAMERKYGSRFKAVFDAIKQLIRDYLITAICLLKFVIASASEAISSLCNKGDCRVAGACPEPFTEVQDKLREWAPRNDNNS